MKPVPAAQSLAAFEALFDASPTAVAITRRSDGRFAAANPAFLAMVGYAHDEVVGHTSQALKLWLHTEQREKMLARLATHGHAHNLVHELRPRSGKVRRVVGSVHVVDLGGEAHLLAFLTDLHALNKAHAVLLDSVERLDLAESAAGIGFWTWDKVSGHLEWSAGLEALYGVPKGRFGGSYGDFAKHIFPADVERYERARDAAIASRTPFELEFRIVRTDGAVRWMAARGAATYGTDGSLLGATGINIDITENKERQLQLHLQAQIMNNMAEGVVLVGADTGRIVYANPRYERMLGYEAGKLVGLPAFALNAKSGQDPVEVAAQIIAELETSGRWQGEIKNRRRDGREIWCRSTVSAFHHIEFGKVWLGVNCDITAERHAQRARDEAIEELRQFSTSVQETLEAERATLSRDLHDTLGAALTGIRMRLEAITRHKLAQGLRAEILSVADTAQAALLTTREICSRLRPSALDELGLAETCRWYLREWEADTGIRVGGRLARLKPEPETSIATDLFRVTQELLTNVARHAGADRVRVDLGGGSKNLRLRLADNGHGFATDQKTRGLGLAGVRERVRRHGGTLSIESSTTGTAVTVTIPRAGIR
jgi:PAS domain S-box-containing protein